MLEIDLFLAVSKPCKASGVGSTLNIVSAQECLRVHTYLILGPVMFGVAPIIVVPLLLPPSFYQGGPYRDNNYRQQTKSVYTLGSFIV